MDYSLTNQVLCGIMTIGKNENFQQLVEALERWTVGNPIPIIVKRNPEKNGNNKNVQTKQSERVCVCVYCEENRPYILRLYKCKNRD